MNEQRRISQGLPPETEAFTAYMQDVDREVWAQLGCSVYDLPDYCYRDAFEDGEAPETVARKAIRAA